MRRALKIVVFLALLAALCSAPAHAGKVALLIEEPYGQFGALNPTGHAAIYLTDVCAETPVRLRRCGPGETGVVLSRYSNIDGYDWLAMPLLSYLYAVKNADQIPAEADKKLVTQLRDAYRRQYLMEYIPDDPQHKIPRRSWTELMGASYIRKIHGFAIESRPDQDDALIATFNDRENKSHFNLLFNNCANFAESVLNFYFPHSIHRNFIGDAGLMTPKQTARSLEKYAKGHPDLEFTTFVIPQVPGTISRSNPAHGVIESLVKTKKYLVPLAVLHPEIAGGLLVVYLSDGPFHRHHSQTEEIFDPRLESEPGTVEAAKTSFMKGSAKTATLGDLEFRESQP
ncbi:MAG: hypothetical protein WA419_08100 [Silvibacterium sp.]